MIFLFVLKAAMESFFLQFDNYIRQEMLFANGKYSGRFINELCIKKDDKFPLRLDMADTALIINFGDTAVKRYTYQIPQTRIIYRIWDCAGASIRLWSYFDSHLLLISNDESGRDIKVEIVKEAKKSISIISNHKLPCKINDGEFFVALENMKDIDQTEIISFVRQAIQKERSLHPLASFRCSATDKITAINKLWSCIPFIDKERRLDILQMKDSQYEGFLWLQEIFLIFGWRRELDLFYEQIEKNGEEETIPFYKIAYNRYQIVMKRKNIADTRQSDFNENSLLDLYLDIFNIDSVEWKNIILKRWEEIHFPILRRKIEQKIKSNPDEWMAFLLLSIDAGFWWKDELYEIMRPALEADNKLKLLNFLMQIKEIANIGFTEKGLFIHPVNHNISAIALNEGDGYLSFGINCRKNNYTSSVQIEQDFQIKIDQNAGFEISQKDKIVRVVPADLKYATVELIPDYVEILFNAYTVYLPLIWNQFSISLNNCRLRFLRKKNRFQVTIRFKNNQDKVFYNKREIDIPDSRVAKIYHDISKKTGKIYSLSYNNHGVRSVQFSDSNPYLVLSMLALDAFGMIKQECNIAYSGDSKYRMIASGHRRLHSIKLSKQQETFTITARYCEKDSLSFAKREGYSDKIFYSEVEELLLRMVIYLNINDKKLLQIVQNSCIKHLDFVPQIVDINYIKYNPGVLGVMVDNNSDHEIVADYKLFSVIKTNTNPRINYIYIQPEKAPKLFSMEFFRDYISII